MRLSYDSISEIVSQAEALGKSIGELVLEDQSIDLERPVNEILDDMLQNFKVMKDAVDQGLDPGMKSASGLSGGDAYKLNEALKAGKTVAGGLFDRALVKALAVSGVNACMGRIVAAPTAGSCGIIPAVLLSAMEDKGYDEKSIGVSLFTAAGIGMVIARKASISGAEGGCQAECGSASAMAAAAVVELAGGTPAMASHACAIALKNVLGLVCDPVAGLVEVPCIKRNALGTANALAAADLALAGIESAIPADEVIMAMGSVGRMMSSALRETAEGGLADTPTGRRLAAEILNR